MKTNYEIKNSTLIVDKENWMGIKLDFNDEDYNTILIIVKNRGWDDYNEISKELNLHKDKWIKNIKCGINDDIIVYNLFNINESSNPFLNTLRTYEKENSNVNLKDLETYIHNDKMDDYLTYDICIQDYTKIGYDYDYEIVIETYCHSLLESINLKFK